VGRESLTAPDRHHTLTDTTIWLQTHFFLD
jgi:hypothetical protein